MRLRLSNSPSHWISLGRQRFSESGSKKKTLGNVVVTLSKLNIFSCDFLKTTSTLSETHESSDFQKIATSSRTVDGKTVMNQNTIFAVAKCKNMRIYKKKSSDSRQLNRKTAV